MNFIRPEVAALLRRWAETAIMAALALAGLWIGLGWIGGGNWFGLVPLALGAVAVLAALIAAARAIAAGRSDRNGPGVVMVEEGRIGYLGPFGGGTVALDALVSVDIVTGVAGPGETDLFWELADESGRRLVIPGSALHADRLFDAFGALEGVDYQAMLEAMRADRDERFRVWWRRPKGRLSGA